MRQRAWSLVVPHHAQGARLARRRVAAELADILPGPLLADTITVLGELLGNAVRHAGPLPGGVIRVVWRVTPAGPSAGTAVEIRVTDGGSELTPAPREPGPDSADGRGLAIVTALSQRWGVERDDEGQCVWARLGTPAR